MAAWGPTTADEELGYAYIRHRSNRFLLRRTSARNELLLRHAGLLEAGRVDGLVYQLIHHDLGEYDAATPPVLGEITVKREER